MNSLERQPTGTSSAVSRPPLKPRAEQLIEHLACYGLTTRAIASRLFCVGSPSKTENLFAQLLKQRRIQAYSLRKSPRLSFYTLSTSEASRLALKPLTGRRTGRSIEEALAILQYCHEPKTARRKVTAGAVQERLRFPLRTLSAPYVVETAPEQYFGRIIVPGREARFDYALQLLAKDSLDLERFEAARVWLPEGTFRFVVLTLSDARRLQLLDALSVWRRRYSVLNAVRVDVVVVADVAGPRRVLSGGHS